MERTSREKPRTIARMAEISVNPIKIPSRSVIGIPTPIHVRAGSLFLAVIPAAFQGGCGTRNPYYKVGKLARPVCVRPDASGNLFVSGWQHSLSKTEFLRLLEPACRMRHRPYSSRAADFAEIDASVRQSKPGER